MEHPKISLVHEDSRGRMYSIALPNGRELMLLYSEKGSLRGGHSHSVNESVMVLTGKMLYHKGANDTKEMLFAGDSSSNGPGEVHMGEFLENTWLIESKDAKIGEWKQENWEPMRAKVRANAAR